MSVTWVRGADDAEEMLRSAAEVAKTTPFEPRILPTEDAVGEAMLAELRAVEASKPADEGVSVGILGGRGAQRLHAMLGKLAEEGDPLIGRLDVYTQDAFAPMRRDSSLSFIRDFERLLGDRFFASVRSFTTFDTEAADLEAETRRQLAKMPSGGLDIFFVGHGPEPGDMSHLAYIRTGSGASVADAAGLCPISDTVREHHIGKFKAGGASVSPEDEADCRERATTIWTLGPASVLKARRLVQSVVDASTATAKTRTYRRVLETELQVDDLAALQRQLDENPGLLVRCHPNVVSFILPDVLGEEPAFKRAKS